MADSESESNSFGGEDHPLNNEADEIKRGITIMKRVVHNRSKGLKYDIGSNDKGQPIDPNRSIFVSYIGATTRMTVPISYGNWHSVPDRHKSNIWDDVAASFVIGEDRKKYIL